MIEIIKDHIAELKKQLANQHIFPISEKEINYGIQIFFSNGNEQIPLNIYFSKKKGLTTVVGGSQANTLKTKIQEVLGMEPQEITLQHSWQSWIGTDESGKGDFFGPLVVCGFFLKRSEMDDLSKLNVKDSKLLPDAKIMELGKYLQNKYAGKIEIIELSPVKYNDLYQKFKQQNKKLNEMLAWMHARVILNLSARFKAQGCVVDRFTSDKILKGALKEMQDISLHNVIKAEADIAVAVSSILARFRFLNNLSNLSKRFGMDLPKGSNDHVLSLARSFVNKYGQDRLRDIAKTHFKTYNKIFS